MHLVINATEIGRQRGGNESFIIGLMEGLAALDASDRVSLLTCQWNTTLQFSSRFHQLDLGKYRRLPFFLWQQTLALRRLKADWYLANFFLPPAMSCCGAIVVHDLSFRAHPEYFPRTVAWYMHWLTACAIRRAHRVLTDSEFSRGELLHFYKVAGEKVSTIPMGVSSRFRPWEKDIDSAAEQAILSHYNIRKPYIMTLGNIHPRKNLARLLDAYRHLKQRRDATPTMVWGGLSHWGSEPLLEQARSAGVILTGYVAQEDLPTLYRQAEMLVYPSLYEGFGLPPLEAMACGTPVIASNTTSLPEVTGEAALLVDPTSIEDIADAMSRIMDDVTLRRRLQQAGIERAREFTWTRTAEQLIASLHP